MNRLVRLRRFNPKRISGKFDVFFPQTVTLNTLRSENGGVLEDDLLQYDRHLDSTVMHINRALSNGSARALSVRFKGKPLVDNFPLMLTLHTGLECEPTLSYNGGEPHEIISASGDRIPGGQMEGTVIFLVWKEGLQKWILLSSDNFTDVTKVVLPIEREYTYEAKESNEQIITIPGFNRKSDRLSINYGQTILRHGLDYEYVMNRVDTIRLLGFGLEAGDILYCQVTSFITTAKRGHYRYELRPTDVIIRITEDGTTEIDLPASANGAHSVVVNYGQTILRNNLDYVYDDSGTKLIFTNLMFNTGEEIVLTITQFVEAPGELVPNNWGATGNYRYKLNVVHSEYEATEDNVTVIPVPQFNHMRDDLTVIRHNHMYVYDVDYTIDEIGNVVLLKDVLNPGDQIFFTILQGAMMDVPNFNVIKATGQDAQHLLIDMSYSTLCNFYVLLIQLKHDLLAAPTLKCVDGPAEPICDCFGMPILGGYKAGAFLWVVYNEQQHTWYSLSHGQLDISQFIPTNLTNNGVGWFDGAMNHIGEPGYQYREVIIPHGLGVKPERVTVTPVEPPFNEQTHQVGTIGDIWVYSDITNIYVGNSGDARSKFEWTASTEDRTNDLRSFIEKEIRNIRNSPGKLVPHLSTYTAEEDDMYIFDDIPNFHAGIDKLIINLYQTVLREGIDYTIRTETNGVELVHDHLNKGEILQFTVLEQTDPNMR